jgi:general secretion pathway protein N
LKADSKALAQTWSSVALGSLIGVVLALVLWAPSAWLAIWIDQLSEHQILLLRPSGTVWTGSAEMTLSAGKGSKGALSLPSELTWRLSPTWETPLRVQLNAQCCFAAPLDLSLKWTNASWALKVSNAQITLPTRWLEGLGAPWNTLGLRGALNLQSNNVTLQVQNSQLKLQGNLELNLDQLSSRLSTLQPLGSYRLEIMGGEVPSVLVSTRPASHLLLNGRGTLERGLIHFDGLASTAPGDEMALSNLLNVLGQRQGQEARLHLN